VNLHQIVSSAIGAVNPQQQIGVRVSVGSTPNPSGDATSSPAYATPGAITAAIGGTFTATAAGTTLSVSAVLSGSLQAGDAVSGSDGANTLPAGCYIIAQLSGTAGGTGTYQLSAAPASGTLGACTVTSASTVLDVSAVSAGVLQPGQALADSGALLAGTTITASLGGAGGPGLYSVSQQQTVAAEAMSTAMTILAQVQPLAASELRHVDALNLQGTHRACYVSAPIRGQQRPTLKGGDLVTLPDGSTWLVTQPLEAYFETSGWTKFMITLQDGS
jgi:hypothetical protein